MAQEMDTERMKRRAYNANLISTVALVVILFGVFFTVDNTFISKLIPPMTSPFLILSAIWMYSIIVHLRNRAIRGQIIFNGGSMSGNWSHILGAITWSMIPFLFDLSPHWLRYIIAGLGVGDQLLNINARLLLCEHGIWYGGHFVRWRDIRTFTWNGDELILHVRALIPYFGYRIIQTPPTHREQIATRLQERIVDNITAS